MPAIRYANETFELGERESVLDGLVGHGVPVPSSCRSGVCQTCVMQATDGQPPAAAQQGLKDSLKLQNYFLACVCHPTEDLEVALPAAATAPLSATVKALERLSGDIMQVALASHGPIDYHPGQFIHLRRDRSLGRCYSIASVPHLDEHLHLHVRRLPEGRVSGWIHQALRVGDTVEWHGPGGDCFYVPGRPEQPLLLIGTGSGLAPLYGIVRDALSRGHTGPIRLFHGSRDRRGIYLVDELRTLAGEYPNFDYTPCLSGAEVPSGFRAGRVHEVALREVTNLKDWRLFLCGHPDMVQQTKRKAFLAGASLKDIYSDPFHVGSPAAPGPN